MKSVTLNLLETSGPLQTGKRTALPLPFNFRFVTTCNLQPAAHSLSVKASRFYEPSLDLHVHQITQCHILEDRNLHRLQVS